jgi:hypothetical protein
MAGLSKGALAETLGVSARVIDGLEGGGDQIHLTLIFLHDLARALGLEIHHLFLSADLEAPVDPDPDTVGDDDPQTVGRHLAHLGILHVDDLSAGLGWTAARTRLALHHLEVRLAGLGQALSWVGDSEVRLMPAPGHVAVTENLAKRDLRQYGLDDLEAVIIHGAIGRRGMARVGHSDRVAIGRLRNAGLVETVPPKHERRRPSAGSDELQLTAEARFNLYLGEESASEPDASS